MVFIVFTLILCASGIPTREGTFPPALKPPQSVEDCINFIEVLSALEWPASRIPRRDACCDHLSVDCADGSITHIHDLHPWNFNTGMTRLNPGAVTAINFPFEALSRLTSLQSLTLRNVWVIGGIPESFVNLRNLNNLYI
jgi:hypothetical protein